MVPGLLKNITSLLRKWKKGSNPPPKALYHRIYPTTEEVPKLYGLPKIHKAGAPLRPIVSSIGSITYNAAKVLAEILNPLVGKTPHHVKNSADFVEKIRNLEVPPVHKIISYDVSALFTSIPVDDAVRVVRRRLEADTSLNSRTPLSVDQIMELLQFCLSTTYFVYKGVYYQQTHGTAMGSPVSPIVANLYMEDFEQRALATAPHPHLCGSVMWTILLWRYLSIMLKNSSHTSTVSIRTSSSPGSLTPRAAFHSLTHASMSRTIVL